MEENTSEVVLAALMDIEKNNMFSNAALHTALASNQFMSKQDRAYITRMVEGVTEQRIRLDYIINSFSSTRVNKCKPLIRCVLRMGTYQIFYMDSVPEHAACNMSVKLTKSHGFGSLSGFVNGVLRNIARNQGNIEYPRLKDSEEEYLSVRYSVPIETVRILRQDYDMSQTERILESMYEDKPTAIRVNTELVSVDDMQRRLVEAGISVSRGNIHSDSLLISGYDYIRRIPGFADGYFTVQDQSSAVSVFAAGIEQGDFVLDVCAAPGGKAIYAAQLVGRDGHVTARDISEAKVSLIEENAERMNISNLTAEVYDASIYDEGLEGMADVVIADLPCSGLGVMGKKNDIKYNVSYEKIEELSALQREILDTVCRYVKPGGTLVYSTCTLTRAENEDNAEWFAANHDFVPVSIDEYIPNRGGECGRVKFVQGFDECDGFFVARFRRNGSQG